MTSELGFVEDGVYLVDEKCKDNLENMIELLETDDESGSCLQQLGAAGIFETDLIPLLDHKEWIENLTDFENFQKYNKSFFLVPIFKACKLSCHLTRRNGNGEICKN